MAGGLGFLFVGGAGPADQPADAGAAIDDYFDDPTDGGAEAGRRAHRPVPPEA